MDEPRDGHTDGRKSDKEGEISYSSYAQSKKK